MQAHHYIRALFLPALAFSAKVTLCSLHPGIDITIIFIHSIIDVEATLLLTRIAGAVIGPDSREKMFP